MRILTDKLLEHLDELVVRIRCEHERQIKKWGVQTETPFAWLAFLAEEFGELAQAITEAEYRGAPREDVVKEAIQMVTLGLKIAEMYLAPAPEERETPPDGKVCQWKKRDMTGLICVPEHSHFVGECGVKWTLTQLGQVPPLTCPKCYKPIQEVKDEEDGK